jgi:hypothetical protein
MFLSIISSNQFTLHSVLSLDQALEFAAKYRGDQWVRLDLRLEPGLQNGLRASLPGLTRHDSVILGLDFGPPGIWRAELLQGVIVS